MSLVRALALLIALTVPAVAHADGEHHHHGGDSGRAAIAGPIVIDGYRVELISEPGALEVDRESRLIARIFRDTPPMPVVGATVRLGVAPAADPPPSPRPVTEQTWAGNYTLTFTPAMRGPHRVVVQLVEAAGGTKGGPIEAEFRVEVAAAAGATYWLPLAIAVLIGATAVGVVWLKAGQAGGGSLDLLASPRLARVLTSPMVQPALQLPLLVVTGAVVFLGLADVQDAGLNVAPRLAWTVWWAGVVFTLAVAGRLWCAVCPFGALNEWTSTLTGAWRRLPRVFRNLWWATALFLLLTWADEQLGVVHRPSVTAWMIVALAAGAVLIGLRYERRSFCRSLCPITGLLGLYSMLAPIELRAKDAGVCRAHREKACYAGTATTSGCPMIEFPQTMDRNNNCTLCLECARGCGQGNLALRLRSVGRDLWTTGRRALDEAYLAAALVGLSLLVTARMLSMWPDWISSLARWLPAFVRGGVKPVTYLTAVDSLVLLGGALVAAPLLLLGAAVLANRLAGGAGVGVRRTFVTFAYMLVPVALALHLAHNLSHLLVEGPKIVPAAQRALALYTPWTIGEADWQIAALAGPSAIGLLQVAVVLGFFTVSLLAGHRLSLRIYTDRRIASLALVPFAVLSLLFTAAGLVILGQPMGMRHGM